MVLLTVNILLGLFPVSTLQHGSALASSPHPNLRHSQLDGLYCDRIDLSASDTSVVFEDCRVWHWRHSLSRSSPKQTLYNCLGAATFYCVIFVVVTSYFRAKLGSRLWKKFHYVAYAAATFLFVHGILIDPNLKNTLPICWTARRCWWKFALC